MAGTSPDPLDHTWQCKLPVRVSVATNSISSPTALPPFYVLAARQGYLSSISAQIWPMVQHVLPKLPGSLQPRPWLDYRGVPLKSTLPIGTLYDLLASLSTGAQPQDESQDLLPWHLTLHYTHAPPDVCVSWLASLPPQTQLLNSLKEACHICKGTDGSSAVMRMEGAAQDTLWCAIEKCDVTQYRASLATLKVIPSPRAGGAIPPAIPVRVVLRQPAASTTAQTTTGSDGGSLWDSIITSSRPIPALSPSGAWVTLGQVLHALLPRTFPQPSNTVAEPPNAGPQPQQSQQKGRDQEEIGPPPAPPAAPLPPPPSPFPPPAMADAPEEAATDVYAAVAGAPQATGATETAADDEAACASQAEPSARLDVTSSADPAGQDVLTFQDTAMQSTAQLQASTQMPTVPDEGSMQQDAVVAGTAEHSTISVQPQLTATEAVLSAADHTSTDHQAGGHPEQASSGVGVQPGTDDVQRELAPAQAAQPVMGGSQQQAEDVAEDQDTGNRKEGTQQLVPALQAATVGDGSLDRKDGAALLEEQPVNSMMRGAETTEPVGVQAGADSSLQDSSNGGSSANTKAIQQEHPLVPQSLTIGPLGANGSMFVSAGGPQQPLTLPLNVTSSLNSAVTAGRQPSCAWRVCGVQPPLDTPLAWLHAHMHAPDYFLYIVIRADAQ